MSQASQRAWKTWKKLIVKKVLKKATFLKSSQNDMLTLKCCDSDKMTGISDTISLLTIQKHTTKVLVPARFY